MKEYNRDNFIENIDTYIDTVDCWSNPLALYYYLSIFFEIWILFLSSIFRSITTIKIQFRSHWQFGDHSNLEYVLVKKFCPNKSDDKFMNYRQQTTIFH